MNLLFGCLGGHALLPGGKRSVVGLVLAADTVGDNMSRLDTGLELLLVELGEAPLARDEDLLATGELELGATKGLLGSGDVLGLDADGHQRLANLDTGDETLWFTVGTTHTGLETISTGT